VRRETWYVGEANSLLEGIAIQSYNAWSIPLLLLEFTELTCSKGLRQIWH